MSVVVINRPIDEVASLLAVRPARWLSPFLFLATRHGLDNASTSRRPWYRLGEAADRTSPAEGSVAVTVPFVWWPHRDSKAFDSFHGFFRVESGPTGCTLALSGTSTGGELGRCQQILDELMHLIGGAMSVDQASAE